MFHYQCKQDVEKHLSSFNNHIFNLLNTCSIVQPSTEARGLKPLSYHVYCIESSGVMDSREGPGLYLGFRCFGQGMITSYELYLDTVTYTEVKKSF